MRIENANASDVLERILSAYGFTMQKELAERLDIAKSNVAGWLQRGQVPGNVIVQCALDTGADINWIVTGELAKANFEKLPFTGKGKALYDEIMSNGGKPVLRRIMDAYGFTLQKQLCDLLEISSGTVSTWVRRGYFPGDVVVACALDTGVSLQWLATGKGSRPMDKSSETKIDNLLSVPIKKLHAGKLELEGKWDTDLKLITNVHIVSPVLITRSSNKWLLDEAINEVSNGQWLLSIDGKNDIYHVTLLPGRRINISSSGASFACDISDVVANGKVILTLEMV